jgi:aminopeptidase N
MMKSCTLWLILASAFLISCKSQKAATSNAAGTDGMEHVILDTMTVTSDMDGSTDASLPPYQPAKDRDWDLLHTKLDLSFDWKREVVKGIATLTMTPLFYEQDTVRLDARGFEVHSIKVNDKSVNLFQTAATQIIIPLFNPVKRGQEITVVVDYSAHPAATEDYQGNAITSDQGLFFIDPQDTVPGLPTQLWTQGETTNNSRWFPTFDQPNERMTQEVILTVADTMMTLSNGIMISSTTLPGGLRRDHWKLDLPHAPYLAMVAVGQWDKVTDYWRGRPVDYYVDLGYGPSARDIFANTPEMIDFFSRTLGYDFVWPKYAQVIVKQFVSGAMENTTAVVFGDFIQFDKTDIVEDGGNDNIVAHELFHHWFGDLVTCESWANLVLNEGFANYAEYLWQEYKYGKDRADMQRMNELSGYFDQAMYDAHPLAHYHYDDEEAMFDAHSYNKGGLVLHMLRDLVGDEAFFASLKLYLKEHAFKAAEIDDLRQAFEETTGKDLNWFFNQWYFASGHPVLNINHDYDAANGRIRIDFEQQQKDQGFPAVFTLPVEIAVIQQDSSIINFKVTLDAEQNHFELKSNSKPLAVVVDPRDILLAVVNHTIDSSEYSVRALADIAISHRISAFRMMTDVPDVVMDHFMRDSSTSIRALAVVRLAEEGNSEKLAEMAKHETYPVIQYYLLESLRELDPEKANEVALKILQTSDKVPMIYSSLLTIAAHDQDDAIHWLTHFKDMDAPALYAARAVIYAPKGTTLNLDYFRTKESAQMKEDYLQDYIGAMAQYLSRESTKIQDEGLALVTSDFFLRTADNEYRRFYLITGLLGQYYQEENESYKTRLLSAIKDMYNQETNEYLRSVLQEGLGDLLDRS